MWRRIIPFVLALTLSLFALALFWDALGPGAAGAQESSPPLVALSSPIGGPAGDFLRVIVVLVPTDASTRAASCTAEVEVDILDLSGRLLMTSGPALVTPGAPLVLDRPFAAGPAPDRQEVVARAIERSLNRRAERGSRGDACTLLGSMQINDLETGKTRAIAGKFEWDIAANVEG